jgi:DNA-directed RNA polymerase specialized sigma24 family protein
MFIVEEHWGTRIEVAMAVPYEYAKPATAREGDIRDEIEALTSADLLRLESYAAWRLRGLGRHAAGRTADDLVHEAILSALSGTRKWNRKRVDFVGFLTGAMRSISSNWAARARIADVVASSDSVAVALHRVPTPEPGADHVMEAAERERGILARFESDRTASIVLRELLEGETVRDICVRYRIDQNQYQATLKRIRRRLAADSSVGGGCAGNRTRSGSGRPTPERGDGT